jgi:hypothetical protein
MTRPKMMNYEVKADTQDLRDRILAWAETNILADWTTRFHSWSPHEDNSRKWGLFIDGGTVGTKRRLLAAFFGEPFSTTESGESWVD